MNEAKIGLIGLAVMGQNLVVNFANKQIPIAIYNRTLATAEKFVANHRDKPIFLGKDIKEFISLIERPRKIILLIKAGEAVDAMIENILPYLDKDDIIIDGGNSFFQDSQRRFYNLKKQEIRFMGMGVSGGEKGALEGPSLMPGGSKEVYEQLQPYLLKIAAQDPSPCVDYMGNGGAGHFVKMVHNGIEYADMQLISESYTIAKQVFSYTDSEVADLFDYFQTTDLNSYLIEITAKILRVKDPESSALLIDKIKDEAKGKGTGTWTVQESAKLGAPVPAIEAALDSRNISSSVALRDIFKKIFGQSTVPQTNISTDESRKLLEGVLLVGKILAYEQGFSMLRVADKEYGFDLNMTSIAKIWRNGCIIRSTMLDEMSRALSNSSIISLVEDEYFSSRVKLHIPALRKIATLSIEREIAIPALTMSLGYLDGLKTKRLSANLIQAQRDFFGAHTYQRIDKEGDFHTQWEES